MTFNELKIAYNGYVFRTGKEDWKTIKKTKGNCLIDFNVDDYDEEVFFDVINDSCIDKE